MEIEINSRLDALSDDMKYEPQFRSLLFEIIYPKKVQTTTRISRISSLLFNFRLDTFAIIKQDSIFLELLWIVDSTKSFWSEIENKASMKA